MPISMADLAKEIMTMTKSKSRVVFRPFALGRPNKQRAGWSQSKEILGWEPKISRNIGLGKTINYFKKELAK